MAVKKSLKEIIRDEYKRCSQDPIHFMRKYCIIQHPTKGKMYFNLYPFQEKSLTELKENRYNIILKSRQLGISTLTAGYALWRMIFRSDFIAKTRERKKFYRIICPFEKWRIKDLFQILSIFNKNWQIL